MGKQRQLTGSGGEAFSALHTVRNLYPGEDWHGQASRFAYTATVLAGPVNPYETTLDDKSSPGKAEYNDGLQLFESCPA